MNQSSQDFCQALQDLMAVLKREPLGMIIGGIAVIALGYPRVTTDIDATVPIAVDDLESFLEQLSDHGIIPRLDNAIEFARSNHVLLMRHEGTGIDMDITLAKLPFEKEALAHRRVIEFAGVSIAIPRVEDLVVYKMIASRPEDLRDVEELMLRYKDEMDFTHVKKVVTQFAALLDRPDLVSQLEAINKRVESES